MKKRLALLKINQLKVLKESLSKPFDSLKELHTIKPKPTPGEWLYLYDEDGITTKQYKNSNVTRPNKHSKIFICELGEFVGNKRKILNDTMLYISAFFGLPTQIHSKINFEDVPNKVIRPDGDNKQILTTWVLKQLKKNIPIDSQSYVAFTTYDLYPDDGWNFVFGEAHLSNRTGVWSIFRFGDENKEYKLCLKRTIATAAHEILHTYGMDHCIGYECLMNGSNSLEESDKQPMWLCPQCLEKLCWNSNLNPKQRYRKLIKVCDQLGFQKESIFFSDSLDLL